MRLTSKSALKFTFTRLGEFRLKVRKSPVKFKTCGQIALEHFDFFYGPIYRERWPSIRLGLLCEPKLCALINNFTDSQECIDYLKEAGAFDLMDHLRQTAQLKPVDPSSFAQIESTNGKVGDEVVEPTRGQQENVDDDVDFSSRSAEGLMDFLPPTKKREFTKGDRHKVTSEITRGGEKFLPPVDVEIVPDDELTIPSTLRVFHFHRGTLESFKDSPVAVDNILSYYLLDVGTIFSVLALDVKLGDAVLDMCASPGGSSLSLLQTLLPRQLVCNDVEQARTNKVRHVLNRYIPHSSDLRDIVVLKHMDPSDKENKWTEFDKYNKVLVNAPSTNDRDSVFYPDEDNIFRPSLNSERLQLPDRQRRLLMAAIQSLRVGGNLVYTTSSLSPIQNDAVVENALRDLEEDFNIKVVIRDISPLATLFRRSQICKFYSNLRFGQMIVPFLPLNYGPMYVCKMTRVK